MIETLRRHLPCGRLFSRLLIRALPGEIARYVYCDDYTEEQTAALFALISWKQETREREYNNKNNSKRAKREKRLNERRSKTLTAPRPPP